MVNFAHETELPFVIRDINKEMSFHSEKSAKIPRSYVQGLPKDLMEYSSKNQNKFLNNHLSIIEEIAQRYPNHGLPKWMRNYNLRYFESRGILAHDGFFNNHITPDLRDLRNIGYSTSNSYVGFGAKKKFTDDYSSSSGWTQSGTTISVTGGAATWNNTPDNSADEIWKSIGFNVNDTLFCFDFQFSYTSKITNPSIVIASLSNGTGNPYTANQNSIFAYYSNHSATQEINLCYKQGSNAAVEFSGTYIQISGSTTYYCRIVRTSATSATLYVYSDSGRTSQIANSPITLTISSSVTGLNTLIHSGGNHSTGGGSLSATLDNVAVYDNSLTPF